MPQSESEPPAGYRISFEADPPPEFRAGLAKAINAFHADTVPFVSRRFALQVHDDEGRLTGGLIGVIAWGWLFVEAVWVEAAWRGRGAGRALMGRAETHARAEGCHSVWLDSFQAGGFYEAIGYEVFATLEDYPGAQSRRFFRKKLT
jgi:GNAT superfamily N-acetyltransferase